MTSEAVNGKVDVWSEENIGTEIRVTFTAEALDSTANQHPVEMQAFQENEGEPLPFVTLVGFPEHHKGTRLLKNTLITYLTTWWDLQVADFGDIFILNEDASPVVSATEHRDVSRPFIILSSARGNPALISISTEHERIGGFCRVIYKPCGPSRLRILLKLAVHAFTISKSRTTTPSIVMNGETSTNGLISALNTIPRRNSEETHSHRPTRRPILTPRSSTAHTVPNLWQNPAVPSSTSISDEPDPDTPVPTITVGSGGTLLKASIGSLTPERHLRVLVVEDNNILRSLLYVIDSFLDFDSFN